ncbi:HAD-IIB family hydrolase [Virgibacillus salexigens]|uniref:HAD-IIB family hydrolase n=1 Tax=Virgibacillus massiliensis TaxID=1462526 RepID=UPI00136B9FEF|nr:HAD-IIB family hydrolase [Virgibacillus massiliensis]
MKFVFDLDGTICFNGEYISEPIIQGLEQLERKGHELIFASARPIRDLLPVLPSRFHRHQLIGGNGAIVQDNGKVTSTACFDRNTFQRIEEIIEHFSSQYLIDGLWNYSYTGAIDHPIRGKVDPNGLARNLPKMEIETVIKVVLLESSNMNDVERQLKKLDVVIHRHEGERVLDISPKGVDKWSGLQQLEIKEQAYVAFGNDANDVTMFQHASHSIMIGHHHQLAPFAKETIPFCSSIEQKIVQKLNELAEQHVVV